MTEELLTQMVLLPSLRTGEVKLSREQALEREKIREIGEVTRCAMAEISSIFADLQSEEENTLAAEHRRQDAEAEGQAVADDAAHERLTRVYLLALLHLASSGSAKILSAVDQTPVSQKRSAWDDFKDGFLGR